MDFPCRQDAGVARPDSPCIGICALDAAGYCTGCLRTGEEIARWTAMSAAEQWTLVAVVIERRRRRAQREFPADSAAQPALER